MAFVSGGCNNLQETRRTLQEPRGIVHKNYWIGHWGAGVGLAASCAATPSKELRTVMATRRIGPSLAALIVALVLAFSTLGLARANTVGLYGGLECYGTGTTGAADGAVNADTFINGAPCNGATQVYLAATTPVGYANHAGTWGVVGIYWGTAAPSVNGTHNLCHFVCNGYANTSAP